MFQGVNPQVSALHTHQRTKSSPDPLNMQNMSLAEGKIHDQETLLSLYILKYRNWYFKVLKNKNK